MKEKIFDVFVNEQFIFRTTEYMLPYFLNCYINEMNLYNDETNIQIKVIKE